MSKTLIIVAICIAAAGRPAIAEDPQLTIAADRPIIELSHRQLTRRGVVLPSLEVHFRIDARCPMPHTPVSMMLSIADSRRHVQGTEIDSALNSGLSITVPAPQIAPVFMPGFCAGDDTRQDATVPDLLSVQGSLTCGSEDDSSTTVSYASAGIDVSLRCPADNEQPASESN